MIRIKIENEPDRASGGWNDSLRFSRKWMSVPAVVLFVFLVIGVWASASEVPHLRWMLFSATIAAVFYLLLLPAAGLAYRAWREFQHYGRPEMGGRWVIAALIALLLGLWFFRIAGGSLWVWLEIPVFNLSPAAQRESSELVEITDPAFPEHWSQEVAIGVLDPDHPAYRFILDQDDRGPPNFASEWRLITIPCGTACQQVVIIHRNSRVVLWGPTASTGVEFAVSSSRLVVNPPHQINEAYGENVPDWLETKTYQLVSGGRPRLTLVE